MSDDNTNLQPWKKLKSTIALETPWFNIRKDELVTPRGVPADYYVHEGKDGVLCVCVADDGRFIIEAQYRPPIGRVSLDHPAGGIESFDHDAEAAALREVEQETGLRPASLKKLATLFRDPGFSRNKMHIFLARGLQLGTKQLDDTEDIVTKTITADELKALLYDGQLNCAACVAATLFAFKELGISV